MKEKAQQMMKIRSASPDDGIDTMDEPIGLPSFRVDHISSNGYSTQRSNTRTLTKTITGLAMGPIDEQEQFEITPRETTKLHGNGTMFNYQQANGPLPDDEGSEDDKHDEIDLYEGDGIDHDHDFADFGGDFGGNGGGE